jgi:hypothetical protein
MGTDRDKRGQMSPRQRRGRGGQTGTHSFRSVPTCPPHDAANYVPIKNDAL